MADGSVLIDTKIDDSGLSHGLSQLGSLASKGLGIITKAVGLVGSGLSVAGGFAAKTGMEFDSAMAQVAATWGKSISEIGLARQAAIDYGATTAFSATEAAQALNYLALAGYGVDQAVDVLPAVLDLAAAGNMDLAYASDLATDAMAALGIAATKDNLVTFGDKMASTASHANTSVSQLGEAIIAVGGNAKMLQGGTDELCSVLGVLANRGIKGSEAGTNLRNILLALSDVGKDAAEAMEELGISTVDSTTGSLKSLDSFFSDFAAATKNMSQVEKQQYLSRIFNRYDLAAAQALLSGCNEEWEELEGYIADADGAMSQMALTQLDNLAGDVEEFSGALESLGIAAYDVVSVKLRDVVKLGTSFIDRLTKGLQEGGYTGLASALGGVLSDAIESVTSYLPSITTMATEVITSLSAGIVEAAPTIGTAAADIIATIIHGCSEIAPDLLRTGLSLATSLGEGLANNLPTMISDISGSWSEIFTVLGEAGTLLAEHIIGGIGNVSWEGMAAKVGTFVSGLLGSIVSAIPDAASMFTKVAQALIDGIVSGVKGIASVGSSIMGAIVDSLTQANDSDAGSAIGQAGADILDGILDGITNIATSPDMSNFMTKIGEGISAAITFVGDVAGKIVSYILSPEGLSSIYNCGVAIIEMLGKGIAAAASGLAQGLGNFMKSISYGLSEAFGFGDPRQTVIDQAAQVVNTLGDEVASTIDANGNKITAAGVSVMDYLLDGIESNSDDLAQQMTVAAALMLGGMEDGLRIAAPDVFDNSWMMFRSLIEQTSAEGVKGIFETFEVPLSDELAASFYNAIQSYATSDGVGGDVEPLLRMIGEIYGIEIPDTIAQALAESAGWTDVEEQAEKAGEFVSAGIEEALEAANVEEKVPEIIGEAAKEAEESAEDMLSKVNAAIKAGTPAAESAIDTATKAIVEKASEQFTEENGKAVADTFLTAIKDQITTGQEDLVAAAEAVATATLSALQSILTHEAGAAIGSNVGKGVAAGISGSKFIVSMAAVSMALSALTAAKGALGIHSPSTAAKNQIGKNFTAGAAEGILDNEDLVLSAIGKLARDMTNQEIGSMFTEAARSQQNSVSTHAQDAGEAIAANTPGGDTGDSDTDYEALGRAIAQHFPKSFTLEDIDGEYIGTIAEPTVSEVQAMKVNMRKEG